MVAGGEIAQKLHANYSSVNHGMAAAFSVVGGGLYLGPKRGEPPCCVALVVAGVLVTHTAHPVGPLTRTNTYTWFVCVSCKVHPFKG